MMKKVFLFFTGLISMYCCSGQSGEAPNYANSALLPPGSAQASKQNSAVNIFTGQPSVSIPIYSYKGNSGISLSVSVDYTGGGGIQVGESPTITGLGWFLNAGGVITRTVRGMPDDMPATGFMYAAAIPTDFRTNANKYYHDSLDTQQDVFQFNFPGHSGNFYMGKNGQIIAVPFQKIKIIPAFQAASPSNQTLKSFRIVAEDGIKYDFENSENTTINVSTSTPSGYYNQPYGTAWYLTRIIAPFTADTIKLNYVTRTISYGWKSPQITFVNNANGSRKTPALASGSGGSIAHKISSISFPDKTSISFIYSATMKYDTVDYALERIKISDTAFRFGYIFEYLTSYVSGYGGGRGGTYSIYDDSRLLLKSVTPYTKKEKQEPWQFDYNYPLFPPMWSQQDTIQNKRDHWGFLNGAVNHDTLIPKVNGYSWGANRNPGSSAGANSLLRSYLPTGGYVQYNYELNDHYPYTKQSNSLSIAPATNSQNNITLNQVFNPKHQMVFLLDKSVSRIGSAPITGSGILNVYIKSTDGSITYRTTAISLYDLFYQGIKTWIFNLPSSTYRLETSLAGGTSITGSFPVSISWENKNPDNTQLYNLSGGIRVATVANSNGDSYLTSFEQYKYITADGRSSGFMGDIPKYDYPYREVVINGGTTTTDYTAVSSEPVAPMNYTQGSPVGYSRVEIIRNSFSGNLGKEVQEFTDLKDVNSNVFTSAFPYTPQDMRLWGLGMPKRVSVYDSSGILVQRTVNTFQFDTIEYTNDNFKSLKLGNSQTTYNGNPNTPSTPKTKSYIGENYYLTNGRAYLTYTADTLYQSNGSVNTNYQQIFYDTNYNVTKIVTSYDRNRGLQKEQRMYYPYQYTVGGVVGKLRDSSIITIPVATETWITGDGNPRITSGAITTYKQIASGAVKPDSIYSFESNKPVPQSTITVFDPAKLNRNTTYFRPQSYFVNYDAQGNLSEAKSLVTGQSSAVISDYDQQYAIAKVSNAAQNEIAYTSFEAAGTGNWTVSSTLRDITEKMTGKRSYNLSNGNITRSGLSTTQFYLLTVWAKATASVSVNSTVLTNPIASQQGWNLYSVNLSSISSVTVSGSGLIDELRLHPKDANMMTTTYEPMVGITSTTDANNTIVYNEYDNLNRPMLIRDKDKNIIRRFQYADSAALINTDPNWQFITLTCTKLTPAVEDSIFQDMNINSDSYGQVIKRPKPGYNCSCYGVSSLPQFRVVNGICELGTWSVTSSVKKKVNGVWVWDCTYRYCFSDGSSSFYNSVVTESSACTVTCSYL